MRLPRSITAALSALAIGALVFAAPIPAANADQQWHYRAQVDGRGGKDRITITAQPGFTLSHGFGQGQMLIRVDFASGRFAEVWQDVSYYSVRKPWTPWLGASNLDHRGGKEIVVGFSTGAHAQGFIAYTYRPNGELGSLRTPGGSDAWFINASFGTGASGWLCTPKGVQARTVAPSGTRSAKVTVTSYKMRGNGQWKRTKRKTRTVKRSAISSYAGRFARFSCPGLPTRVW